ncbi:hypothetical protein AAFC00_000642 [Neodothiora populina]|uniref:Enoyl reductase (ER) domain-containing protein n=1 Tax=Neodothiora populina TaxID=2781224 RepID=A0ABR3PDT3_9PEZI
MAVGIPESMRACQWTSAAGGLEHNLTINNDAALPTGARYLGKDQTLVKVAWSALNPVDYKLPELPLVGRFAIKKPASPSMDFSGIVVDTRRNDLKPGQRVFGKLEPPQFGALAEYAVVGSQGVVPVPENVHLKEAGCVGVAGLTAYQCIVPNLTKMDSEQPKIFINGGSGGTGSFGIQIAKALGCYVVTSCSGANADLCKSIGADEVIDYKTQDIVQMLKRKGTQFDLIVDNVGSSALYWQAHHYLKPTGKVVAVGATPGLGVVFDMMKIFLWPASFGGGQRKYQFLMCAADAAHYTHIGQMMRNGQIKPVIGGVYQLGEVPQAFQKLKAGGFQGKLVVQVSTETTE